MAKATSREYTLEDLLVIYNSISPSRTRWVRNRNDLRNKWNELFIALEKMSGRNGMLATVYDPNWHKLTEVGVRNSGNVPVSTSSGSTKKRPAKWSDADLVA